MRIESRGAGRRQNRRGNLRARDSRTSGLFGGPEVRPGILAELRKFVQSFGDGIVEGATDESATLVRIKLRLIVDQLVIVVILELSENHDTRDGNLRSFIHEMN